MLVLTRRIGESFVIGDGDVIITLLEQKGDQVRVGIEAPRTVPVHRYEVYRQRRLGPGPAGPDGSGR